MDWPAIAAIGLVLTFCVASFLTRPAGISGANDDATYVFLAQSLRQGSYRDVFLVGQPLHGQYPPGWPALVALLQAVFGSRTSILSAASVFGVGAALVFLFDLIRRRSGAPAALLGMGLLAINPYLIGLASKPGPDGPFILGLTVVVWAMMVEEERESGALFGLALGSAVVAFLLRVAGVAAIAAVFLAACSQRRWRRAVIVAAVGTIAVGGWGLWVANAARFEMGRSYVADLAVPDDRWRGTTMLGRLVARTVVVLNRVRVYILHFQMESGFPVVKGSMIDNVAWIALLVGLIVAARRAFWGAFRPAVFLMVAYAGVLIAWPWTYRRYLVPILPFLVLLLVVGAVEVGRRRRPAWAWVGPVLLTLMFLPRALTLTTASIRPMLACDRGRPLTSPTCWPVRQRAFLQAASWARSLPDSAVVATPHEASFAFYSGRKVLRLRVPADSARFAHFLDGRRPDYIVAEAGRDGNAPATLLTLCRRLRPVSAFLGLTVVLAVSDTVLPPHASLCDRPDFLPHSH